MSTNKIYKAIAELQAMGIGAEKDAINPRFNSGYVSLQSVMQSVRDVFAEHNVFVLNLIDPSESGRPLLTCKICDDDGNEISSSMLLPDIADPQKIGSAITYYRRYLLLAMTGLAPVDDDGNDAKGADPVISESTWSDLNAWLNGHDDLRKELARLCGVNNLRNMRMSQLEAVRNHARKYLAKKEQADEDS